MRARRSRGGPGCGVDHNFTSIPPAPYRYLLGLYFGDGCISKMMRAWKLRLALDASYPGIINEASAAMEAVVPGKVAHCYSRPASGYVEVSMYWRHWPCLIPQHGPGRKHLRRIALRAWQDGLVREEPQAFLRGLIHSDGCRVVASDRGRPSVRYHFSNRSDDIKALYCAALESLGISWTRPCNQQIAVYRQASVEILDRFIGPKR
jgi:hypothetical protein